MASPAISELNSVLHGMAGGEEGRGKQLVNRSAALLVNWIRSKYIVRTCTDCERQRRGHSMVERGWTRQWMLCLLLSFGTARTSVRNWLPSLQPATHPVTC